MTLVDKIKGLDYWQSFLLKLVVIYVVLHVAQLYFNESTAGIEVNRVISNFIGLGSSYLMNVLGYSAHYIEQSHGAQMYVDNVRSVYINHSCNAFNLLKAFFALLLASSHKSKHLIWYMPLGVISIFLVNTLRVFALALIYESYPDYLEFNHKYVFTIVVYSWIFLLFLFWVNRIIKVNDKPDSNEV